jgi:hypothetical protein
MLAQKFMRYSHITIFPYNEISYWVQAKVEMTYSVDLRERVVAFVNTGGSKGKAANLFKVSRWCVYNWLKCEDLNAKKNRPKVPWKLDSEALKAHV